MDFMYLEQPMKLNGSNIDPRYFIDNEDGTYSATPLLKYKVGSNAQKYFKKMIEKLDTDNKYFKYVQKGPAEKEVKDNYQINKLREKYAKEFELIDKRFKEYQDAHPDEFEMVEAINVGSHDENKFTSAFRPDINISLSEALNGYLAASELVDKYGKDSDNFDNIPTHSYLQAKRDFWEAHRKLKESWYEEYGIPAPEIFDIKKMKPNVRFSSKAVTADGQPDEELLKNYALGFCEYLTESNSMEFKAKAEEVEELIDENFEIKFDDRSTFMTKKDPDGTLAIFTMPTVTGSGEASRYANSDEVFMPSRITKIIQIEPDDDSGTYEYHFEIRTDEDHLNYTKLITTKNDLQKAIKNSLNMTQDIIEFRKYFDDLQDIYNTL